MLAERTGSQGASVCRQHNANLLLDFAPGYSGRLPAESRARYQQFGDWVRACYGQANLLNDTSPVPAGGSRAQAGTELPLGEPLVLVLPKPAAVGRVVIMEDQRVGQRIANYTVEGRAGGGGWSTLVSGESIGHKRIVVLPGPNGSAPTLDAVRLTLRAVAGAHTSGSIRSLAAFGAAPCVLPPAPPHAPCELEENFAFKGSVLRTLAQKSVGECCSACRAVAAKGCVAFARDAAGHCTLFKALGGGQQRQGTTSGSPIWG